jgi:hypothetical protein
VDWLEQQRDEIIIDIISAVLIWKNTSGTSYRGGGDGKKNRENGEKVKEKGREMKDRRNIENIITLMQREGGWEVKKKRAEDCRCKYRPNDIIVGGILWTNGGRG